MKQLFPLLPIAVLVAFGMSRLRKEAVVAQPASSRTMVYCAPAFDPVKMEQGNAPVFEGLGNLHYAITTNSAKAQKYFNQGLTLLYAFNHSEAGRSFLAALKLDSTCAMAYWGMGMVLGPNYNAALNPSSLSEINNAMDKAVQHSSNAKPNEKALIYALSKRFPRADVKDMSTFNSAYSAAMKEATVNFPTDPEIGTLYADALMNEHPWNLWLKDGNPQPWTPEIILVLEKLLKDFPNHVGTNHMYIHAMEASKKASSALTSANKLRDMLPAAGHIVHMPSHIYIRTGHYHDGVIANEKASLADSNYVTQCKVQSAYALLLYPHNLHFLTACAFLEGNSKKAIEASWKVANVADKKHLKDNVTVQHFSSIPYYVLIQFGKWNDILSLPSPGEDLAYPQLVWHYARGMAYAGKGNIMAAKAELGEIRKTINTHSLRSLMIWDLNSAEDLANICEHVLEGEIAAKEEDYTKAINLLTAAIAIEDSLNYNEPPDWFFSVRLSLGHILLQAKKFKEAEAVYRQDLETFPENGWALKGLYASLVGLQKHGEATRVSARFEKSWNWADVNITSSRLF